MAKQPNPAKADILTVPAEVLLDTDKAESKLAQFKQDAKVEVELNLNGKKAKQDLSNFINNAETTLKRLFMKKKNNPLGISFQEMENGIYTTAALYRSVLEDMERNTVSAATNIRKELVEKMEAEFPNIKVNISGIEVIGVEDIANSILNGIGDIKEIDLGVKDIKLISSSAKELEKTTGKIVENEEKITEELSKQEKKDLWKKLNTFTGKIKRNLNSLSTSDMREVLSTVNALKDTEEYGQKIKETFSNISASFVGVGEVSGLLEVVSEFEKSASTLRNVDWGFGKLHDKNKLIEEQKEIIDQLKQIGKLRYTESRNSSGVDIFTEGFDDEDYQSRFTTDELRTRVILLEQLRDNINELAVLTKAKKITLFDDSIYHPENIVYAIGRAISSAQAQFPAIDEYDVPNPEDLFKQFEGHVGSVIDRKEMSKRLQDDFEFYKEAILNGRYTVEDAIDSFAKDIKVDQFNTALEKMFDGIELPQGLLSKPEELAASIRNGSIAVEDAINEAQRLVDRLKVNVQPDEDPDLDELFTNENKKIESIQKVTDLIGKLTSQYGEESFDNIFGKVIASFGELDASNAIDFYNVLIAKDQEYQNELRLAEEKRKSNGEQVKLFVKNNEKLFKSFENNSQFLKKYTGLLEQVSNGMLLAADASEQLKTSIEALKEQDIIKKAPEEKALRKFRMAVESRLFRTDPYETDGMQKTAIGRIKQLNSFKQELEEFYRQGKINQQKMQEIESQYDQAIQHTKELGAKNIDVLPSVFSDSSFVQKRTDIIKEQVEAMDNLRESTEKLNETKKESQKIDEQPVKKQTVDSKLSSKLLDGSGIDDLLKSFNIPKKQFVEFKQEFAEFGVLAMRGEDTTSKFNEIWDKLIQSGSAVEETQKIYEDFYDFMRGKRIKYDDSLKAEFGDDWTSIINKFRKVLTKKDDRTISAPDQLYSELLDVFPAFFDKNIINPADQLKEILTVFSAARLENAQKSKTVKTDIPESWLDGLSVDSLAVANKIYDNAQKISNELAGANQEEKLTESAQHVSQELDKQGKLSKKVKDEVKAIDILEKDILKTIEQINDAERRTRTGHDFNVSTPDELQDRFSKFSKTLSDDTGLKIGKIKVGTNVATLELYNDELKTAIRYTYQLTEAAEGENAQLELVNEVYEQNIKALQENKFDATGYQAIAKKAVEELRTSLKGLKDPAGIDFNKLSALADGITSKDKWTEFNNQIKAAKKNVDTLKQSIKTSNSMNTLVSTVRGMENADATIQDLQVELNKLGDIPGIKEAQKNLDKMTEAAKKYKKEALTAEDQVKFFNQFNDAEVAFKSQLSGLRDLASMTADMNMAEITIHRMQLTLSKFKDVDGINDAINALERMTNALNEFNDTNDTAKKALAYQKYTSAESELKARVPVLREADKELIDYQQLSNLQEKLYESKKKLVALEISETANNSDLQTAERKTEELQQQYDMSLSLLKNEEDYNTAKQRELQLEQELKSVIDDQLAARVKRISDAEAVEESRIARQTELEIRQYDQEQLDIQNKQIANYNELIKLQKKFNTADYKWQEADVSGADKTPYNKQMKSYTQRMQAIREETVLTAEQEVELNRINNEHLLKKQKLLNNVAAAEQKYNQQVADITSKVSSQMDTWGKEHAFTRIFSDELNNEINAFKSSLSSLSKDTNFSALNKQWDQIVEKTKQATKANQDYVTSAWKDRFQNEYMYTDGKTKQDQGTLDHMADYYKQEESKAQQFNNDIKSIYDRLMNTIKEINTIDTKMQNLSLQDKGSGLYANMINELQTQKSSLVADLRSLSDEIQNSLSLNLPSGKAGFAAFFSDLRVQAALTTEEIKKFDDVLRQSEEIKFNFGAKISEQIQPTIEKLTALKKMIADGFIDKNSDIAKNILGVDSQIANKYNAFKSEGSAFAAMDLMKYTNSISKYISMLDQVSQKEAQYFAGKTKYSQDTTMDNMIQNATEETKKLNEVQKQLEQAAISFAKQSGSGDAFITKFTQGADGIFKLDFSVFDTATNSLRNFRMEMGSLTSDMYVTETTVNKSLSSIQAAQKQMQSMSDLITRLDQSGVNIDSNSATGQVSKLLDLYKQLKTEVSKGDGADKDLLSTLTANAKITTAEVEKLYKQLIKMRNDVGSGDAQVLGVVDKNGNVYSQMTEQIKNFAKSFPESTLAIGNFNNVAKTLDYTLTDTDGVVRTFRSTMDGLNGEVTTQQIGVRQLGSVWQQMGTGIARAGKQLMSALIGYNMFYEVIAQIRQGYQYVKEIDLAMTELKKVTDESEASYSNFLETASKTANVIGSTVSDFTNATSNFARLGYTINESAKMAETAIIYKNVADGLDTVEASTDSIISTMNAFGISTSDTMGIIDSFNAVGNNFAITSAGIGEAMQRSASALHEGGNTFDESIALITAANSVIQNPTQVGTALKTLTLRLRGAKVELEEAGLDAENMAESTSTLQEKLKALTHGKVDIMLDTETFKSTTQILREMSAAWDEMTDIERASALELMGGKRQANILASVIRNFDIVEDVIETSMNSEGSALAENAKWLDSIEGKTTQLTNSMQALWNDTLNSDVVKFFLDVAKGIVDVTKHVGLLKTALASIVAYNAFSSKTTFGNIFTTDFKLSPALKQIMTGTATKGVKGFAEAFKSVGAGAKIASIGAQALNGVLSGFITLGISTAIQGLVTVIYNLATATEQATKRASEAVGTYQSEISTLKDQKKTADDLATTYKKLASGVNTETNTNIGLTTESYKEYLSVCNQIADIYPDLVVGYDAQGNAILSLKGKVDALNDSYKKARENAALELLTDKNKKDIWTTYESTAGKVVDSGFTNGNRNEYVEVTTADQKKMLEAIMSMSYSDLSKLYEYDQKGLSDAWDVLRETLKENGAYVDDATMINAFNSLDVSGTLDSLDEYKSAFNAKLTEVNQDIASGMSGIRETLSAKLVFDDIYNADSFGDESRAIVESIINNMQPDIIAESGAESADEFYNWFSANVVEKIADSDYQDIFSGINNLSDEMASAISDGDSEAFNAAKSKFGDLIQDWVDEETGNVEIDENADVATQYLQQLAQNIQDQSKNYQVKLQMQTDFDSGINVDDILSDVTGNEYKDLLSDFNKLGLDFDSNIDDVYSVINSALAGDDGNLRSDELTELYNKFLTGDTSDWTSDQIAAFNVLDSIINKYGTDIDTVKAKLIELGYVLPSVDDIETFDFSSESTQENVNEFESNITTIKDAWNSLNDKSMTKSEFIELAMQFPELMDGVNLADDNWMVKAKENLEALNSTKIDDFISMLIKAKGAMEERGEDTSIVDSFINYANQIKNQPLLNAEGSTTPDTISELTEYYDNYKTILDETNEIIYDGQKVSEDYYSTVKEYVDDVEELDSCFDKNNKSIVTNSKKLKQLITQQNKETLATTRLAKSQSRLEYYNLVKQLNNALSGTKTLDAATRSSIITTLTQIDAVERALYQYQLLEDSLLGVTNAFEEFTKAQEIDSMNTYGDSYVEMVQTLYDGWYKTGQVGTEAFQTALKTLIPSDIGEGLDDAEKLMKQYEYFNKHVLSTGKLDEDQFSLDFDSMEEFVKKGIKDGVFTGDTKDFDLVEGLNLDEAAEKLGYTREQAYAMFAELDKYNVAGNEHSFLSQLDDSLEGRITNITNDVEELNRKKMALLEDDGYKENKDAIDEINEKLSQSEVELNKLGKEAYTTWQEYTKNDAALSALGAIEDKQRKLTKEEANQLGIEWDADKELTVQQAYDQLLAKQLQLGEPTVLTAQLAIENIDTQIATLQGKIDTINQDPEITPEVKEAETSALQTQIQALEEDKVVIATTYGIELSEEDQETLQEELNAIEEFKINDKEFTVVANGTSETMAALRNIQNYHIGNKSYTVTTVYKTVGKGSNASARIPGSGGRTTKYANGTAHALGTAYVDGDWGAPKTETALVGELGPELVVRNGRWHTVGDNGAEFTQVKKGDIIFNHKQTEELLKNGYVTSRGKAYASGTAYAGLWKPTSPNKTNSNKPGNSFSPSTNSNLDNASKNLSNASDKVSDSSEEFRETFDWIEVRLEEINEDINLKNAQLENKVGYNAQNKTIDQIIDLNQKLYDNLIAGAKKYYSYASKLLSKIPAEYREAAKDGTIAIETFVGETDEKTLEAIQEYREWVQKGADATQQAEETLTEISSLAKQAIDNIADSYDNKISFRDNKIDQYEAYNSLLETDKGFESEKVYKEMIKENNKNIKNLEQQRDAMQTELNKRVKSGEIKKYSQDWYDTVNDIAAVDTEIIELKTNTEDWQDTINELHWEKFDLLISKLEAVSEEADNLINILSNDDMVDESGNWTKEGITTLGLYAQQMEAAEVQAKKYKEEIAYLNKNWKKLGYTEEEYIEKLDELKSGQYDAIQAYHDSKDAIVDLNQERIGAIKEGIEKEIEAYEELINKKKEKLDAEKDLYDFQKSVMEQEKDIADIERQLAALSGDNSASARAKRAQLEAELAEANAALEDSYYERSISNQQEALDKELENFQEEKDAEIEGWDKYLENTEQVVADSLTTVQENTKVVYQTLRDMGKEYGLSITESLTSPWKEGECAIQSFSEKFGITMSATVEELKKLEQEFKDTMTEIEQSGIDSVNNVKENAERYTKAEKKKPKKNDGGKNNNNDDDKKNNNKEKTEKKIKVGGKINAGSAKIYDYAGDKSGERQYYRKDPIYKVLAEKNGYLKVRHHKSSKGVTGWFKKSDVKAYAKGSTGVDEDQWALLHELGDELVLSAGPNGKLQYITRGTAVIPHDISENLMELGQLDPSIILDQNRPQITAPHITNNEISINMDIAEVVHVDRVTNDTLPDLTKAVRKELDSYMTQVNNSLKRFTR